MQMKANWKAALYSWFSDLSVAQVLFPRRHFFSSHPVGEESGSFRLGQRGNHHDFITRLKEKENKRKWSYVTWWDADDDMNAAGRSLWLQRLITWHLEHFKPPRATQAVHTALCPIKYPSRTRGGWGGILEKHPRLIISKLSHGPHAVKFSNRQTVGTTSTPRLRRLFTRW